MLKEIAAVFPKHPIGLNDLTIRRGWIRSFFSTMIILLVLVGGGLASLIVPYSTLYPEIKRDWEISKDFQPFNPSDGFAKTFRGAKSILGECATMGFVLTDCNIHFSYRLSNGNATTQRVKFSFFDVHFGSYTVGAVRSASNPDLVTVDLAISTLWNRVITMLIFMAFGVFMLISGPYAIRKGMTMRKKIQALTKIPLRPVSVRILYQVTNYGITNISYSYNREGKEKKYNVAFKRQTPFLLQPDDGSMALGLTADGYDYVFLVDEALKRLDIQDFERNAIWKARETALAV